MVLVASAEAQIIGLYDDDSYQYSGTGTKTRSQHFSPSEAMNPLTNDFDSVMIMVDTSGSGTALTGTMTLYNWVTNYATSVAGTPIGSVAVNVPLGQVGATITLTGFGQLDYQGQYLMDLVAASAQEQIGVCAAWGTATVGPTTTHSMMAA